MKHKVVFIMGATATGKSKLSIALANHFSMEVVNCDMIQVYRGLDLITNKVTESEMQGVPHHLLSVVDDPGSDFTADDFCSHALKAMDKIILVNKIPIVVGGSNSFIQALVENPSFKSNYDACFIWIDVSFPVHQEYVYMRVDDMVTAGLVKELLEMYEPAEADTTRGIWRAIGVPEMKSYLMDLKEFSDIDNEYLLKFGIHEMKINTCALVVRQLAKIHRLKNKYGWPINRIDATLVFEKRGKEVEEVWEDIVVKPSVKIVNKFLGVEEEIPK